MADVFLDARTALESAGYTMHVPDPTIGCLHFEDSSVLGVLHVLDSVAAILDQWEQLQDRFLRDNAPRLDIDPLKTWNSYTVLLTHDAPNRDDMTALFAIEEDFRGTRKIARAGITARSGAESALAPLLPLRRLLSLEPDDAKTRLATRLGDLGYPHHDLLSDVDARTIAASVIGSE